VFIWTTVLIPQRNPILDFTGLGASRIRKGLCEVYVRGQLSRVALIESRLSGVDTIDAVVGVAVLRSLRCWETDTLLHISQNQSVEVTTGQCSDLVRGLRDRDIQTLLVPSGFAAWSDFWVLLVWCIVCVGSGLARRTWAESRRPWL